MNMIEANAAALHLRRHDVPATVVGHHDFDVSMGYQVLQKIAGGPYELMLIDPEQQVDAERILESFEAEPVELAPDWERVAKHLDLSLLDPEACAITCPACGGDLPLDNQITACPDCAAPVDIIQRLVDTHGPDALADAIIEEPEDEEA